MAISETIAIFEDLRKRDPKNELVLGEQPAQYAKLADYYAAAGQMGSAAQALRVSLDRLKDIESKRALVKEEQNDREASLAKLAEWERK